MANFSWRQWLQGKHFFRSPVKRRPRLVRQPHHVEGLESRTMLTAPVAVDDSGYTVSEDGTLDAQVSVLSNDTDVDNDPIVTATLGTNVSNGILDLHSDGTFTYTPNANFNGTDSFTYFATDNQAETSVTAATVTITVNQLNDAGTFGGDTSGTGAEDTAINGALTFADAIDGFTTPDFTVTTDGVNGVASIDAATGAWTYTPNANFNGSDSFTVSVTDDAGNVETQVINVTVTQVDDAGTFGGDISGTGAEDTAINGALTFADAIDGFTTPDFTVTTTAVNGVASIDATTGAWTYTPNADFSGTDSFIVSVTDDGGNVETQLISLTVTQVNDAGTFGGDTTGTGDEDNAVTGTLTFADAIDGFITPNFTVTTDAVNGVASIDATTGAWTYTPNANFNGTDSFTVSVTDDQGNVETQVIGLTINQIDDAGTFGGDITGSGDEDTDIAGTLTFADAADGFTTPDFTVSAAATNGIASIDLTTGEWTYTPNANYFGVDSFTVSVTDDNGNVETQVISVTVNSVNDLGTFGGDISGTGAEDNGITGTLTFADAVEGFTTPGFTVTADAVNGVATINAATGEWSYTPNANFNGTDSFTVSVTDDGGNVETQVISLTVTEVDDPGTFGGDVTGTGAEDGNIAGALTFADAVDGFTTPDFTVVVAATNGVATIDATTGAWSYTPNANYFGSDTFSVSVTDDDGNVETQVVTLTVTEVADLTGLPDDYTTSQNTLLNGDVSTNDSTTSGGTLTYSVVTDVAHGALTLNSDGTFSYTPDNGFVGTDTFEYSVLDASAGESTTLLVTIAVGDLTALDDSFTTLEDEALAGDVSLNDATTSGGTLAFAVATDVSHGVLALNTDGTFTYTPEANYNGSDSFTYTVSDPVSGESQTRTVTLAITSAVDLTALDDSFIVDEDTPLTDSVAGNDATTSGGTLTYTLQTDVSSGILTFNADGSFNYNPSVNFNGSDGFTYLVIDAASGESSIQTVTITVTAVNDTPLATATAFSTDEEVPYSGTLAGTDVENDSLTFAAGATAPSHGQLVINSDGTFTYTPDLNFDGTDSFTFTVSDGNTTSAEATVSITVNPIADNPIADPLSLETAEDTPYSGTLTGSDGDQDQLAFAIGSVTPSHGTVVVNADGTFVYTPNPDYNGPDTFTFKVNDGTTDSPEATVTIAVTSVNDAPTVTDGSGTVNEDAFLNGSVSSLGADVESDMLTYAVVTGPAHGTLVLNPDGTFVYTPDADFSGTDSFTFRANDGQSNSNDGTFAITVAATDDPLTLNLPGGPVNVDNNNKVVKIDPAASVGDADTEINYTNAAVRLSILSGNTSNDTKHNRVSLKVVSEGNGAGQIKVRGSRISFDGSRTTIAKVTGGKKGQPLVVTFTSAATQAAVDAVLQQLGIQASRKASPGDRTLGIQVTADGQTATGTKIATIS